MSKKDGGPAFLHKKSNNNGYTVAHPGMTLRDYFAGQVLCGLLVDPDMTTNSTPKLAYEIADAMLAARSGDQS